MTTPQTITVLGATGKTGRRVSARLKERGHRVRAASRRGSSRFDWEDESTWSDVIDGASAIYLVPHEASTVQDPTEAFVDRAVKAGVRRLVLLSAREWVDTHLVEGLEREEIVRGSGTGWTILRPVWFAQNFSEEPFFARGVIDGDLVHGTGEGAHPFVDVEDIASVAAVALTDDRHHARHYSLSGPRALTVPDAAAIIAKATGRPISTRFLTEDAYRAHLVENYYSPGTADGVLALSALVRRGEDACLSDGVQRALGREPRDFADYVEDTVRNQGWGSYPSGPG
ncbi:NAD(P)H-binding protein [Nocardiopsis sp. SBT366]|uniref:NmrA family NAD(P)-binding protein n=1 Tax=Nocardiopsis sp. SBT366 TaxID=1580529 RepID=UPI00066C83AD|nr:NAD(P)H-binding protein [Nocardiopsis sp. SBT366]